MICHVMVKIDQAWYSSLFCDLFNYPQLNQMWKDSNLYAHIAKELCWKGSRTQDITLITINPLWPGWANHKRRISTLLPICMHTWLKWHNGSWTLCILIYGLDWDLCLYACIRQLSWQRIAYNSILIYLIDYFYLLEVSMLLFICLITRSLFQIN